ncbi:hypothetical protein PILCRDRAFT_682188 [Piloderma croceum F 1598]|uniref:Uncharacterized protein n=1 Tax=Piloderma croceum (strain F 1598) TaxID=765440 RepID=A0A0C3F5C9_PILCF|nr:hypothetical protein PILCRDRAFT_682188 [Piloderma croceum F 1598]
MVQVSTMMRAPKRPYPSFTFALTQESHPMCAPMFDVAYIRPYKRSKLCRAIDLEDTLMMTEGGRYRALLDDDSDTLASLEDAISSEVDQGRIRLRRPSLSTLVIVCSFFFPLYSFVSRERRLTRFPWHCVGSRSHC